MLLLAVLGHRRSLAACAGGLGIVAAGFGLLVRLAPLPTGVGVSIAIVGGVVCCAASIALVLVGPPASVSAMSRDD